MCPHIPYFPPEFDDWKPAPPPFPPIPSFFVNPLTPEQRAALEREFGPWAAGRTVGMISPKETFETHKRVAARMYETFMGRLPPKVREPKERKAREPTIAEELIPELESDLVARLVSHMEKVKRPISVEYRQTLETTIQEWAKPVELTKEDARRIVNNAIEQYKMVTA